MELSFVEPDVVEGSGSRKEVFEFVEGARKHAVGEQKGLFNAIAVMHVDIDVDHSLKSLKQLHNGEHTVVDVAEPGGLLPLGVMESATPVDGDVDLKSDRQTAYLIQVEQFCAEHASRGVQLAEIVKFRVFGPRTVA